jgi:hypothetical protein
MTMEGSQKSRRISRILEGIEHAEKRLARPRRWQPLESNGFHLACPHHVPRGEKLRHLVAIERVRRINAFCDRFFAVLTLGMMPHLSFRPFRAYDHLDALDRLSIRAFRAELAALGVAGEAPADDSALLSARPDQVSGRR